MSSSLEPEPTLTTPLLQARSPSYQPPLSRNLSLPPFTRRRRSTPPVQLLPTALICFLFAAAAFIAWDVSSLGNCYVAPLCRALGNSGERPDEVWWRNAGAYAPWRSMGDGGGQKGVPRGCNIDQVNIMHRHATRYPTAGAGERMRFALTKLKHRRTQVPRRHAELAFLSEADFDMTGWRFDQLMDQGRKAAWRSGRELAALYRPLIRDGEGVFSRASAEDRVMETGGYWMQGFCGKPFKLSPPDELPNMDVIVPDGPMANNTLHVHICPSFDEASPSPGTKEASHLHTEIQHTVDRLNSLLRPQPSLDAKDVIALADMCAYDSQANHEDWEAWSKWCGIFRMDEWELLGHFKDVLRYYQVGQGSIYGATLGVGWIRELLARLSDSTPIPGTTINSTLDSNNDSFPQGGQRLFVDFSHDNEMIEVLTAMHAIDQHRHLPTDSVPPKRTYLTSHFVPFGARLIVERIACDLGAWEPDPNTSTGHEDDDRVKDGRKDYVRILLNDEIRHVNHIACKQSGFVEHGMCELDAFLDSQRFATIEVDWGICFR